MPLVNPGCGSNLGHPRKEPRYPDDPSLGPPCQLRLGFPWVDFALGHGVRCQRLPPLRIHPFIGRGQNLLFQPASLIASPQGPALPS